MHVIIGALLAVFISASVLLLVRGIALKVRRQRDQEQLAELRRRAVNALGTQGPIPPALAGAPRRLQRALVLQLSRTVGGAEQRSVRRLAHALGLTTHALRQCRSRAWWKRLAGARLLTAIRSDAVIVLQLLDDPHPLVRAQALEWAGLREDPEVLSRVATLLNDESPACRFAAKDTLLRAQHAAIPSIRLYLETGNAIRGVAEALEVVPGIAVPELAPAVERHLTSEDPAIRTRAVLARAAIGGNHTSDTLRPLLNDPAPEVRAAVAEGLGMLHDVHLAADLMKLLHDSVWEVRQRAALALRALGAPGELLLRAAARGEDRHASDIARQTLDAPAMLTNYPVILK